MRSYFFRYSLKNQSGLSLPACFEIFRIISVFGLNFTFSPAPQPNLASSSGRSLPSKRKKDISLSLNSPFVIEIASKIKFEPGRRVPEAVIFLHLAINSTSSYNFPAASRDLKMRESARKSAPLKYSADG